MSDAWTALERTAFLRTRRGLVVREDRRSDRPASLWTLVHVVWAACDVTDAGQMTPLTGLTDLLERYRRGAGYAPSWRAGRRYFDDDAWLGLASLRLAAITGAAAHRERAAMVLRFVRTGEDPAGGIRWVEGRSTRNACSTASAAWLALLVDGRGDRAFAGRIVDWLIATLLGPDGLIADRIDRGRIDRSVWSYNQGATAAALRLLGRGDDAAAIAAASLATFSGERRWREPPPFLAIWHRALLDDPTTRSDGLASVREHVDRMRRDAFDAATGTFTRGGIGTYDGRSTIDHAASVQLLAMDASAR